MSIDSRIEKVLSAMVNSKHLRLKHEGILAQVDTFLKDWFTFTEDDQAGTSQVVLDRTVSKAMKADAAPVNTYIQR